MILRNKDKFFGHTPQHLEVDGQPALLLANGHGQIMSKDEFYELVELATRFYEADSVDDWIKHENNMNAFKGHPILGTPIVDKRYTLPEPRVEKRQFKKNLKRSWGFHCDWCNHKMSSKTDTDYFRVHEYILRHKCIEGQCCSQACAENLWYDLLIEWILEEKRTDTFHTDKTIKA